MKSLPVNCSLCSKYNDCGICRQEIQPQYCHCLCLWIVMEVPFHTLLIESLKLFFLSPQALLGLTAALADAEFYAF